MKTSLVDVTDTRKTLVVEIPCATVDAEIDRVTRQYGRAARIPGFRPGKVPPGVVRQRYRQQILHDVARELVPRAVDDALRERGVEPVDAPNVQDVRVEEGQPLTFTAAFDTVPPIDPGDYGALELRRIVAPVEDAAIEQALERLRQRMARFEPVEDRPAADGDVVVLDLERRRLDAGAPSSKPERHQDVSVEIGAAANPPGFDDQMSGLAAGDRKTFTVTYPGDYAIAELAGALVEYAVEAKSIKRRVVPPLDGELAKDLGDFETLEALRARVREDLRQDAEREADREARADLLKQLAGRIAFEVPAALVERELDRRIDELAHGLITQQIDPRRASIDWDAVREGQRAAAVGTVRSALVLDEVARREGLAVTREDLDREVESYAARTGRAVPAVRATLEREGGLARLATGLRREKAIDFLLSRAKMA